MTPILADANKPESYLDKVSAVDVVYMDNVPHVVGGDIKPLEEALLNLAREVSS